MLKKAVISILLGFCFFNGYGQLVQVKTFYDDDSLLIKESFEVLKSDPSLLQGKYLSYYPNSKVKISGQYKNNQPTGIWTYYYENGNIKMTGQLVGKFSFGHWKYYFENGELSMEGDLDNNQRQGNWKMYFETGGLKSEGAFEEGEKTGIWNHYYEDGTLKAQAYYEGEIGFYKEYYNNGNTKMQGYNIHEMSDSTWVYYYESGEKQALGQFSDGQRNGKWTYFYKNGNISAEGMYLEGEKNGAWSYYHENGKLSSTGEEKDGKKEGQWKIFDPMGQFKGEGEFSSGTGPYYEYHTNGNLKVKGQIEEGVNTGQWIYYYENGIREGECFFVNGEGEYTGFYPDGSVKMKGTIKDGKNIGRWELFDENGDVAGYYKPIYEDDKPIFKVDDKQDIEPDTSSYIKPDYRYRNRKNRYFDPVINEFKGIIIGTNPLATIIGSLPVSLEYYFQERLGHEIQFNLLRDPFFKNDASININELYNRGFDIAIRQKLYRPDRGIGMFYMANELRYTYNSHYFNAIDSTNTSPNTLPTIGDMQIKVKSVENKIEYSFIVGNRWIKLFGDRISRNAKQHGITVDAFLGIGLGYRNFKKNYSQNEAYDRIFDELRQENFSIVPRFGVNIGYIF